MEDWEALHILRMLRTDMTHPANALLYIGTPGERLQALEVAIRLLSERVGLQKDGNDETP